MAVMPSSQTAQLSRDEAEQAQAQQMPRAAIVFETVLREGEGELQRTNAALAFSGLAAGLSMGFSLLTLAMLHSMLPDAPWRPLVENFGYSVGFLIVILGRQQLFTENTLTPILPLLDCFSLGNFGNVMRLWGIVLASNIAGALLFAWALVHVSAFPPALHAAFLEIGKHAAADPAPAQFVKAIFAGWLIALMVWLLPAADTARPWIVLLLTWIVGAASLSHIVAGSVETGYAMFAGAIGPQTFALQFFAPVLVGNIIGGTALVALLAFGQVASDANAEPKPRRQRRRARPKGAAAHQA
jgi:formate/nitrite transporter FocA (FNT family)